MTLLLRAIVAARDARVAAELGLVHVSGTSVAALASAWETTRPASEAELLDHHRVVQEIFERVPCLPARFGSVFGDDVALRTRLIEREAVLAAQLATLGHRCELAITCAWRDTHRGAAPPENPPRPRGNAPENRPGPRRGEAGTGRAYLERGLERTRNERERARRAAEIATRLLGELAVEPAFIRHRTCPRPAVAVSMSALVTRDEIDEMSSRVERLGAQLPDVTTVVQGPWAPYTFAVNE